MIFLRKVLDTHSNFLIILTHSRTHALTHSRTHALTHEDIFHSYTKVLKLKKTRSNSSSKELI